MKLKKLILKNVLLLLMIIVFCSGCNGYQNQLGDNNNRSSISQVNTHERINQSVANQAKEKIIRKKEISAVKAVNTDKELLVAIRVDNFHRFRLKKIEKNVKTDLEKMYKDLKVNISADSKIYLEVEEIEKKLQKNKIQMKTLNKDIKEIKSLLKEQT